ELYPLFILMSSYGSFHILETVRVQKNLKPIKFVSLIILLLFFSTLIPESVFQRTIEKEVPTLSNANVIEVNQPVNDNIQMKRLHISHPGDSITSIIIELNDDVKVSDI